MQQSSGSSEIVLIVNDGESMLHGDSDDRPCSYCQARCKHADRCLSFLCRLIRSLMGEGVDMLGQIVFEPDCFATATQETITKNLVSIGACIVRHQSHNPSDRKP